MQAAQAQARAYESLGKSIGGAFMSMGTTVAGSMIKAQTANAPVPEAQVKAAEAQGASFAPREIVSTGGGGGGEGGGGGGGVQYKPITQLEFERGVSNASLVQKSSMQQDSALVEVLRAASSLAVSNQALQAQKQGYGIINGAPGSAAVPLVNYVDPK
jgi:hypothetical protein